MHVLTQTRVVPWSSHFRFAPQSSSPRHSSAAVWHANADIPPLQLPDELAQTSPGAQTESSTQVAGMHEPTGSPQKHTEPGSQSASFMHP